MRCLHRACQKGMAIAHLIGRCANARDAGRRPPRSERSPIFEPNEGAMKEREHRRAEEECEPEERVKDLARGRARGTPWIPNQESANADLIAEDEEGMVGHPKAP
jgi:hypothetical protein